MATENEQLLEEQARLREKEDRKFMRQALTQAKKAAAIDEVPIGCVIVCDGKVIARGYNRRNIEIIWNPCGLDAAESRQHCIL